MYKADLPNGRWVTGANDYGYPIGSKLPIFTPWFKFSRLMEQGLVSAVEPTPPDEEAGRQAGFAVWDAMQAPEGTTEEIAVAQVTEEAAKEPKTPAPKAKSKGATA